MPEEALVRSTSPQSQHAVSGDAGDASASFDRFAQGLETMRKLDGDLADHLRASLAGIAPDFMRYLVEFAFGEIYTRPGLDL